jgi:FkbM family methyltransferase
MPPRLLQGILSRLPRSVQFELRRANFLRKIRRGDFVSPEPEFAEISRWLRAGDWVIDVGANVGHYTCHMARCVGPAGRVIAFEPIPETFALLTGNVRAAGAWNVTLFNVAASSSTGVSCMTIPSYQHTRLRNYYQAHIASTGEYQVLRVPLDALPIPQAVRLVKIDAEGHDLEVLKGMESLLRRDRPLLIVEAQESGEVASWLRLRGYSIRKTQDGSPNIVAEAHD